MTLDSLWETGSSRCPGHRPGHRKPADPTPATVSQPRKGFAVLSTAWLASESNAQSYWGRGGAACGKSVSAPSLCSTAAEAQGEGTGPRLHSAQRQVEGDLHTCDSQQLSGRSSAAAAATVTGIGLCLSVRLTCVPYM